MKLILNHCNCFDGHKEIKDRSIDLILTDLPYGTTDCEWDNRIDLNLLWKDYKRIIKSNGNILLFGTGLFFAEIVISNSEWFKYDIVWEKERPVNIFQIKKQIGRVHENIAVFQNKQGTYNPIMSERQFRTVGKFGKSKESKTHKNQIYKYSEDYDETKIYPRSVLKFNRDSLDISIHPTQKPVELLKFLIKLFSNEKDCVLDSCMGSGSTGVAAMETNRHFVGFEINKDFFRVAEKRITYHKEMKKNFFSKKVTL
jgi:site-specific DNA-methyltransferase (adenine-specific)